MDCCHSSQSGCGKKESREFGLLERVDEKPAKELRENVRHQFDAPDDGRLESNKKLGDLLEQIDSISTQLNP